MLAIIARLWVYPNFREIVWEEFLVVFKMYWENTVFEFLSLLLRDLLFNKSPSDLNTKNFRA